jgi:dihydroneopterin triphosphate diphosphatase
MRSIVDDRSPYAELGTSLPLPLKTLMRRELSIRANSASVVTIRLIDTTAQYLVLRRASDFLRDQWCHVAGAVEAEETAWQTVLRELREETGLVPDRLYSADRFEQFYRPDWDALVFAPVFVAFVSSEAPVRLNHEHSEFRWCPRDEAWSLMTFFTQRANLLHVDAEFIQRPPNEFLRLATGHALNNGPHIITGGTSDRPTDR